MSKTLVTESVAALASVLEAVAPLVGLFLAFQLLWLKLPRKQVIDVLIGTVMASAGLFLFLLGMEIGFLPFGRAIGTAFGALNQPALFVAVGTVLGFLTA